MSWDTVIGLEVHAQLKTKSKLFSGSSTTFGAMPNSQANVIDAGFPGVLPVLNQEAVKLAIQFGLAIDAEINDLSYFERKNYFYPDLPKGYQISQFQRPIVGHGYLTIQDELGGEKKVTIERAHLEEDAGKSLHDVHALYTGIDLNRAGIALLEIVTTPCLFSAAEAISYLKTLRQLLLFLDICDGNMQEGSLRCDVNLSIKPSGRDVLGTRVELKNLNSFRFIEQAIKYEQQRQQDILELGQVISQETRLYSPNTQSTHTMRNKEDTHDYRYFPDPDLLPIKIRSKDITHLKANLPELPMMIKKRLLEQDQLTHDDIDFILSTPATYRFYEGVKENTHAPIKIIINWIKGSYAAALNQLGLDFNSAPINANILGNLLNNIADNNISNHMAKLIFSQLLEGNKTLDEIIKSTELKTNTDEQSIEELVIGTLKGYPQQVMDYRSGKEKLFGFFVGIIMKQTKGQADIALINTLLKKYLSTA